MPFIKDPELADDPECPYAQIDAILKELGNAGISPSSPASDIKDALFDLMAGNRAKPSARLAWDQLRHPISRLLVDFFMYAFDEGESNILDIIEYDRPIPIVLPDFLKLATIEVSIEVAVSVPNTFDNGPYPKPIDLEMGVAERIDIDFDWQVRIDEIFSEVDHVDE